MSVKTKMAGLCAGLMMSVSFAAVAQTPVPLKEPGAPIVVAPKPVKKLQNRPIAAPEAPLPFQPAAPLPYDSVRDTPAAPVPYKDLTKGNDLAPTAKNDVQAAVKEQIAPSIEMIDTKPRPVLVAAQAPGAAVKGDSSYDDRIALAQRLLEVDGTEAIIRHFVNEVHMRLIVTEVGKYIDLNALSEADRYRLASIAAVVATELGDKILLVSARQHAQNLTRDELLHLTQVNDTDAQRKLTQMRIDDTGELDKNAELIMQIAALKIVQEFEKP
ncbi:hypothetical protein PQU92_07595 [Asticcacaulis sp. BYS171W]|uniref:DUF4476 domain-containing protein n=1 Tax=Asticcacaulis aquaticus TaxID=2984212 RepID=A0ABT5HUK3_9CAUL|nr:hypothetical protein [Asticcacaulis aquaticus]MDC7683136.1 hypothetical protein [Asticcacaulis aquaticus]